MTPVAHVMAVIAAFRARIAAPPDRFVLATSVACVDAARTNGQIAIGFDLEGAMPLPAALCVSSVSAFLGSVQPRQMMSLTTLHTSLIWSASDMSALVWTFALDSLN